MLDSLFDLSHGYQKFREKYASEGENMMETLAKEGQNPQVMFVACCDSRVDPAVLLQCAPGDLFVVRNIANIVPPYESDEAHHGTSAALEYGVRFLKVKHLIILGHSQCGGIQTFLNREDNQSDDFISKWTDLIKPQTNTTNVDHCAKEALISSHQNCLEFPWIKQRVDAGKLTIQLWFFDIKSSTIQVYHSATGEFLPLD